MQHFEHGPPGTLKNLALDAWQGTPQGDCGGQTTGTPAYDCDVQVLHPAGAQAGTARWDVVI
jgi:hypothetical protein